MGDRLPATEKLVARPVWRRHLRRTVMNVNPMPPPNEAEMYDAIRVLENPENAGELGLWNEAHRILDEADGTKEERRKKALDELTRLAEEFPGGYR